MPGLNSSRSSRYSPSQRHQTVGSPPARGGGCARRGARNGDAAGLCAVADVEHADGADVGAVRVVQERAHLVLRQLEVEELEQEAERRRRALVEAALLRPAVRPRLDVRHLLVDEVHDLVEGLEDVEALEVLALRDLRVEVVVEVKDVGVRAADLEDRALDADLRHVLREPVAVDARPDGHAELARVREAHPTGCVAEEDARAAQRRVELLVLLDELADAEVHDASEAALYRRRGCGNRLQSARHVAVFSVDVAGLQRPRALEAGFVRRARGSVRGARRKSGGA